MRNNFWQSRMGRSSCKMQDDLSALLHRRCCSQNAFFRRHFDSASVLRVALRPTRMSVCCVWLCGRHCRCNTALFWTDCPSAWHRERRWRIFCQSSNSEELEAWHEIRHLLCMEEYCFADLVGLPDDAEDLNVDHHLVLKLHRRTFFWALCCRTRTRAA